MTADTAWVYILTFEPESLGDGPPLKREYPTAQEAKRAATPGMEWYLNDDNDLEAKDPAGGHLDDHSSRWRPPPQRTPRMTVWVLTSVSRHGELEITHCVCATFEALKIEADEAGEVWAGPWFPRCPGLVSRLTRDGSTYYAEQYEVIE